MDRVIMIKYGELSTKKGNIKFFINTLYRNIENKLSGYDVKISRDISRMYIEFDEKDLDLILKKINNIFGLHEYLVAYKVNTNIDEIKESVLKIVSKENFKTFPKIWRPQTYDYAYAITTHKAQGSEYDKVLVFEEYLKGGDHARWLYTAATRAKKKLVLVRNFR